MVETKMVKDTKYNWQFFRLFKIWGYEILFIFCIKTH